jgi:hypothetical protein
MVRYFAGVDDLEFPPGTLSQRHCDEAIRNAVSNFALVGHQEDAQAAFDQLAGMFAWRPSQLGRSMVSETDAASLGDRARIVEVVHECNRWDIELYAEILKLFPPQRDIRTDAERQLPPPEIGVAESAG